MAAALKRPGGLDKRTALARALESWRSDLVADLGGVEMLSTQQHALVELACRSKLLLDSVDAWLLAQRSLVDKRKRALLPVLQQRAGLAQALERQLGALGLERKAKPVPTLAEWVREVEARAAAALPRPGAQQADKPPPPSVILREAPAGAEEAR